MNFFPVTAYVIIIFTGFSGFLLSLYIYHKKRRKEHMVCPLKADCQTVINSRYSQFMGVPVEVLGMGYYLAIAAGYGMYTVNPDLLAWEFGYILFFMTGMAFLFSGYLTAIQIITLKEYCTWCLTSAGLCTIIFLLAFSGSLESITPLLASNKETLSVIHLLGMGTALGTSTIANYFFFKFLRDFRISHKEAQVLDSVSEVTWVALGVAIMSGVGLLLPNIHLGLGQIEPRFLIEAVVVCVLVVNSIVLGMLVEPRLMDITFGKQHKHKRGELLWNRRLAFVLGGASLVSWYYAFFLAVAEHITTNTKTLFVIYVGLLFVSVLMSLIIERWIAMRANKRSHIKKKQEPKKGKEEQEE